MPTMSCHGACGREGRREGPDNSCTACSATRFLGAVLAAVAIAIVMTVRAEFSLDRGASTVSRRAGGGPPRQAVGSRYILGGNTGNPRQTQKIML